MKLRGDFKMERKNELLSEAIAQIVFKLLENKVLVAAVRAAFLSPAVSPIKVEKLLEPCCPPAGAADGRHDVAAATPIVSKGARNKTTQRVNK